MSEFCEDCKLPIRPCGWGAEDCNNPENPQGVVNVEAARLILGLPENLEPLLEDPEHPNAE
jgi:hypothetical protein